MKAFWADWEAAGKPAITRGPCRSTESRTSGHAKAKESRRSLTEEERGLRQGDGLAEMTVDLVYSYRPSIDCGLFCYPLDTDCRTSEMCRQNAGFRAFRHINHSYVSALPASSI